MKTRKQKISEIQTLISGDGGSVTPAHIELFNRFSSNRYTLEALPETVVLKFASQQEYEIYKKELAGLPALPESLKFLHITKEIIGLEQPTFKLQTDEAIEEISKLYTHEKRS